MSLPTLRPTDAQKRAIAKAIQNGFVMRAGGFSDETDVAFMIALKDFDRGIVIDRCIAAGWMAAGRGYNQYVATDAGIAAIQSRRQQRAAA